MLEPFLRALLILALLSLLSLLPQTQWCALPTLPSMVLLVTRRQPWSLLTMQTPLLLRRPPSPPHQLPLTAMFQPLGGNLLLVLALLVLVVLPLVHHARSSQKLDIKLPELARTLAMLPPDHSLQLVTWPCRVASWITTNRPELTLIPVCASPAIAPTELSTLLSSLLMARRRARAPTRTLVLTVQQLHYKIAGTKIVRLILQMPVVLILIRRLPSVVL
jgi:hypothetical protein